MYINLERRLLFPRSRALGLDILSAIREKYSVPVVTEVMSVEQLAGVAAQADMLQIGSRNMQNFELLKALVPSTNLFS